MEAWGLKGAVRSENNISSIEYVFIMFQFLVESAI